MSAIAGIFYTDGRLVQKGELDGFIEALSLSPGRVGHWQAGNVGLVHVLAAFSSEDEFERQPQVSDCRRYIMTADAVIDNRDELGEALGISSVHAQTLPDSAYILHAYQRWGNGCTEHLEGHFAFAIWDKSKQRLYCARDHLGIRPLYYFRNKSCFAFGSTLKSLLTLPQVSWNINEGVLADFLLHLLPQTSPTLYENILLLPNGHWLEVTADGSVTIEDYWRPQLPPLLRLKSDETYAEAFQDHLERAVAARIRCRGRVAVKVSGGLDSSVVTVAAAKLLARQGKRLQAFHMLPATDDSRRAPLRILDESGYVKALERTCPNIDFHYVSGDVEALAPDEWNSYFDRTCAPLAFIPVRESLLKRQFAMGIGCQLNGLAGNYVVSWEAMPNFYFTHLAMQLAWFRLMAGVRAYRRVYGTSYRRLYKHHLITPLCDWLGNRRQPIHWKEEALPLLNQDLVERIRLTKRLQAAAELSRKIPAIPLRKRLLMIYTVLGPQFRGISGSIVGEQKGLRGAVPLFDRRLNDFCLSIPPDRNIRKGWDRYLMRSLYKTQMPSQILKRTTRGFPMHGLRARFLRLKKQVPEVLIKEAWPDSANRFLSRDGFKHYFHCTPPGGGKWEWAVSFTRALAILQFFRWHADCRPR